jgi:uncharacterized protein (TIGR02594 family)
MIQLFAFRRTLVACVTAVLSIVVAASLSPADAKPRHRGHHTSSQTYHHHRSISHRPAHRHSGGRRRSERRGRYVMRQGIQEGIRRERRHERRAGSHSAMHRAARMQNFENANAALMPQTALFPQDGVSTQTIHKPAALSSNTSMGKGLESGSGSGSGSGSSVVAEARRYIGGNPTGRKSLWCARFMNMVLQRSGHRTTGSDMARSFASYGQRVSGPQVGAIAVMSRGRGGGHVGIVSGVDAKGNPIVVSGNHGRRVAESVYSRSRIYAYVMPN